MELSQTKLLFLIYVVSTVIMASPTRPTSSEDKESRQQKSLSLLDLFQNLDDNNLLKTSVFPSIQETNLNEKEIPDNPFNSPIYYIRLPPHPYMFVPGLGYVSQPAPPPTPISQFVNLPVNFLANGKPTAIYQWSGAIDPFQDIAPLPQPPPVKTTPKPQTLANSPVYRIPGKFSFNGKPEDVYILRDTYNSIYGDILQNIYP
ncbi:uncharacterized protein LOC108740037 [Agrilus planipennis]|uniref:Uncharacterized protein LOC108740037 n=1 Tax=Agrilus planipennis TaxID=224129 RepID=A0A1W4XBJ5_AGRPL|nr:uncharacterized protein LOC108740037 [Agrilus planipennis]